MRLDVVGDDGVLPPTHVAADVRHVGVNAARHMVASIWITHIESHIHDKFTKKVICGFPKHLNLNLGGY